MIIAPLLDPMGEALEVMEVDAGSLIKEVLVIGHKVQWMGLLNLQGFLLVPEEVVEEPLLDPGPVPLRKQLNTVHVVDPEDVLQVLPPSAAPKVGCQPCGITEGRLCPTSPLRPGSFGCWWWWWWGTRCRPGGKITLLMWQLCTRHSWYISWVTDRSATWLLLSLCRPSVVLCGTRFRGPFWWWHHLLVGRSGPSWAWLSDRLPCLGHAWHHCGWCWHSLGQPAWVGCPCNPLHCGHNPAPLPTPGRFGGAVASPATGASGGGSLHLE